MAIQVKIEYGQKSWDAKLSETVSVGRLIPAIITAMDLPLTDRSGQTCIYFLNYGSRRLKQHETLSSAGVKDGEVLHLDGEMSRLSPSITSQNVPDLQSSQLRQLLSQTLPHLGDRFLTSVSHLKERTSSQNDLPITSSQGKTGASFICPKTRAPCCEKLEIDPRRAFIIMPFGHEFDNLYKYVIEPTLIKAGFHPVRGDNIFTDADILCKICHCVFESRLNIVDISLINANVFLELGIVYGMGRRAILIKKYDSNVVSDIQGLEYVPYDDFQSFSPRLLKAIWQSTGAQALRGRPCEVCEKMIEEGIDFIVCVEDEAVYHRNCWYSLGKCSRCQGTQVVEIRV
jgi:uncharacterized ubiquitin-like protein YukD